MIECLGPLPDTYAPGTDDVEFEKASASKVGRLVVKQNFEASYPSLNELFVLLKSIMQMSQACGFSISHARPP